MVECMTVSEANSIENLTQSIEMCKSKIYSCKYRLNSIIIDKLCEPSENIDGVGKSQEESKPVSEDRIINLINEVNGMADTVNKEIGEIMGRLERILTKL